MQWEYRKQNAGGALMGNTKRLAEGAQRALPDDFMGDGTMAKMILKVLASWTSLWLWGLAFWFFFIAAGAHWSCTKQGHHITFSMTYCRPTYLLCLAMSMYYASIYTLKEQSRTHNYVQPCKPQIGNTEESRLCPTMVI